MQFGSAQNCGCAKGLCCSKWGYCGTTQDYCGDGCPEGPCTAKHPPSPSLSASTPSGSIESIVTQTFFSRIKSGNPSSCVGKNFYTYDGFISAAKASNFAGFGTTGSLEVRKRELAAFFANVRQETGSTKRLSPSFVYKLTGYCTHVCLGIMRLLCSICRSGYVEEIEKDNYCEPSKQYPCASGNQYYGREPLQLSWNYNCGAAGKYVGHVGLPLLNNPDLVAQKPDVAFKTSLWFWMINSDCHDAMTSRHGKGFAGKIRAINGGDCGGGNPSAVQRRVSLYQQFCKSLHVAPGPNLSC